MEDVDNFQDALIALDKTKNEDAICQYIKKTFEAFIDCPLSYSVDDFKFENGHISVFISSGENAENSVKEVFDFERLKLKFHICDRNENEYRYSENHTIIKIDQQPIVIIENNENPVCNMFDGSQVHQDDYYKCEIHYFDNENAAVQFFMQKMNYRLKFQYGDIIKKIESSWESISDSVSSEEQGKLLQLLLSQDCFKPALASLENEHLRDMIVNDHQNQTLGF